MRTGLDRDFQEIRDITVIGAGPVGLITAFWAGMREASARIVDSLPELGGQLTALYPEKWIFDVPGHPRLLAKDLVERLRAQALDQFDVPVHLESTATAISWERELVVLHTARGELRSRTVIVAGGHGASTPRRLTGYDMTPMGRAGAHYAVLLQLGFKTALGPLKDWGFELSSGSIVVDQTMKTSLPGISACGDITTFDGKLKLIATGFAEAAIAVAQAVHEIRPEMRPQPGYSTNIGVPGVLAGQP